MRVQHINIRGLFGMFEHRIPLFSSDPVTIIHGPNGIGKTSILRLIYGTLKPDFSHLRQVPFSEIEIQFEHDIALAASLSPEGDTTEEITRPRSRRLAKRRAVHLSLRKSGRVKEECDYVPPEPPIPVPGHLADPLLPFLHRIGPREWHDTIREETLSFEEVIHLYGDELPDEYRTLGEPEWLRDIQIQTPLHFIETQRLLDVRHPSPIHGRRQPSESIVKRCSDDLSSQIKSKLAESATLSQSLERTFPSRLISAEGPSPLSEIQIREELAKIDVRRSRLVDAGLLDRGFEPPLPGKEFDETTKRVLTVYIQDTQEKLAIFDNFLSRVELMKSIVNSRFLYKNLSINREEGFALTTREGRQVALAHLSSGEQHELVLLYELLFRAKENTFILIDEPELSLHIAWQQQFLRDLINIARLAKLQALVATHSPQIIHDRWDLTVELAGPPA